MENEKRLIDAKPLMEKGWHLVKTGESNRFLAQMSLADAPTVDAVEVVRCKDCKHWYKDADSGMSCEYTEMSQPEDGFCDWAERGEG